MVVLTGNKLPWVKAGFHSRTSNMVDARGRKWFRCFSWRRSALKESFFNVGAILNRDEELVIRQQENISTRNISNWRRLHLFLGDSFTLLDLDSSKY